MFRIVMIGIVVTIALVGCGEELPKEPINEEKVSIELKPLTVRNEINTQDVKKNDVQSVARQLQTTEDSQAVATLLANEEESTVSEPAESLKTIKEKADAITIKKAEVIKAEVHETKNTIDSAVKLPKQELALGDAVKGKALAKKCASCHDFGMRDKFGPHLKGVFNRAAGQSGFKKYGNALKTADWIWDEAHLLKWVCDSKTAIKEFTGDASARTKMSKQKMCGEKGNDIVAYLKTL